MKFSVSDLSWSYSGYILLSIACPSATSRSCAGSLPLHVCLPLRCGSGWQMAVKTLAIGCNWPVFSRSVQRALQSWQRTRRSYSSTPPLRTSWARTCQLLSHSKMCCIVLHCLSCASLSYGLRNHSLRPWEATCTGSVANCQQEQQE